MERSIKEVVKDAVEELITDNAIIIEDDNGNRIHDLVINVVNNEEEVEGKTRVVLSLKPHLSPIKAAVIPLKRNNEDLVNHAKDLKNKLQMLVWGESY